MIDNNPSSPRVAVIGCGYWGKNLIRNFAELGALAGVFDRMSGIAEGYAAQYNAPFLSEEEILSSPTIDGIVIATPAPAHESLVEAALLKGKHVYVEKPMALSLKGAQRLASLAKKNNKVLMVGHILNYHPAFVALKQNVNKLGPLKHIYASRLGLGRFREQESILWDLMCHDISIVLALTQTMPSRISAKGQTYLMPMKPAAAVLMLDFPSQITAHLHTSWASPHKEQKFIVVGEKGMAVFDDQKPWPEKLQFSTNCFSWQENQIHANAEVVQEFIPLSEGEPLKNECAHFLRCLEKNISPLTDGEEGVRVTEVLEKAEKLLHNSFRES